jgi:hypothetical protein
MEARSDVPLAAANRHAAEWGLAGLLLNLTLLLLAALALLVWGSVIQVHEQRWDHGSLVRICIALLSTEFLVLLLIAVGIAFSVRGLLAARSQRTPAALPLAALLVGLVDLLFWLMVVYCSFGMTFAIVG